MSGERDYALIGHLDSFDRYRWLLKKLRDDTEVIEEARVRPILHGMPPNRAAEILDLQGKAGVSARGCYIECYFDPEELEHAAERKRAMRKVERACALAARLGVKIASLGGFTSILGEMSRNPITRIDGTAFTTGNTLTCWSAVRGTLDLAEKRGVDVAGARAVVLGASGDIGTGATRYLNGRVRHLDLVARNPKRLERLRDSLETTKTVVELVPDGEIERVAGEADLCIAVASTLSSTIDASLFPPHAVIADVGYPKNIKPPEEDGPIVVHGGMIQLPEAVKMRPPDLMQVLYPRQDITHGCMAEPGLLTMAGIFEPFSHGRGNITVEKLELVERLAAEHGYSPAPPYDKSGLLNL